MKRSLSLDALRGIAILGMVLSGSVTFRGELPAWMYHAQVPPPEYRFIPTLPGITWVDLVFPFFLFSMGAAIPYSFRHRALPTTLRAYAATVARILQRGILLAFFAIVVQHITTFARSHPEQVGVPAWLAPCVGIVGYALLFLVFVRFPDTSMLTQHWRILLRAAGFVLIGTLVIVLPYPEHPEFGTRWSLYRSDIILLVLSNVAVAGAIVWLFTRDNVLLRLGLLVFFLGIRLSLHEPQFVGSWQHWLWFATPAPCLFKVYFLQYLFIVLVGTVAGEMLLNAQHDAEQEQQDGTGILRLPVSYIPIACVSGAFIPANLVGLYTRELWWNMVVNLTLIAIGTWLLQRDRSATVVGRLYHQLWYWGIYWLLLGLTFEVFEGGIKKDKSTLSYYFLTDGLAFLFLISLHCCIETVRLWKPLRYCVIGIVECGQNPMIAYVTGGMLVMPIIRLLGLDTWYETAFRGAWLGFLRGVLFTVCVVGITQWWTRRKIFWRT
ncbi:MAG: DUF5009 domain-containing protein [Bacteroidota bacterium]|nr:DUF5009 domain-containing protein [Candidatus Kapabacteria bacterium]MDW8219336.1 DUF5009 domain-containing protein [Bacteroidota bacterium]